MINIKNQNSDEYTSIFKQLGFTDDKAVLFSEYVLGEKDESVFSGVNFVNFKDLSDSDKVNIKKIIEKLFNKKNKEDQFIRLLKILFKIGESTCYEVLPYYLQYNIGRIQNDETVKLLSAVGEVRGCATSLIKCSHASNILIKKCATPEFMLEVKEHYKDNGLIEDMLIHADYFAVKYPTIPVEDEGNGLLKKVTHLFEKNKSLIDEQDINRANEYVKDVIDLVMYMTKTILTTGECKTLKEALISNKIDNGLKEIAAKCKSVDDDWFTISAGLAYMNYKLIPSLKGICQFLVMIDSTKAVSAFDLFTREISDERRFRKNGADSDDEFGVLPDELILWAAGINGNTIVRHQFQKNKETYLKVLENAPVDETKFMMSIIKELDSILYDKIIKEKLENGKERELEKAILPIFGGVTPTVDYEKALYDYFMNHITLSDLYDWIEAIRKRPYSSLYLSEQIEKSMDEYNRLFNDQAFERRRSVVRYVLGSYQFYSNLVSYKHTDDFIKMKQFFDNAVDEGMDILHLLDAVSIISTSYSYNESSLESLIKVFQPIIEKNTQEFVESSLSADAYGRFFTVHLLENDAENNKQHILRFSADSSKQVKEELVEIFRKSDIWQSELESMLSSKKAVQREIAITALGKRGDEAGKELLASALETEKTDKLRTLIMSYLNIEAVSAEKQVGEGVITVEEIVKELHKGGKKRTLEWAYETPFSIVHKVNGEDASIEILQAICLAYSSMNQCGVNDKASIISKSLNQSELSVYMNELFDKWIAKGAEAKKRWVLYACAIHGGTSIVAKYKHYISEWPENMRGAIASEAVKALALNPSPEALLLVDSISRKFKFKQVKTAAGEALEYAASELGISKEELADKIVPNLGFDENGVREFDYGTRKFKVSLTVALELLIEDENGKKLKNLPTVGQKDDADVANASLEEFKALKKQLKTTVTTQKARLEYALASERSWTVEAWKELFVKNPVMHQFAIGLVWGTYENGKLINSFRYMEDGSFNTEDEDEFEMLDDCKIGLVHPIELSKESLENWKTQLEDYEIKQPINQLERELFYITDEEKTSKHLERFGGYILSGLSLNGKLLNSGWYRGSVQDAGGFYTYYQENKEIGIGAELHFSGSFVGGYDDSDVTVYDVRFYKAGTITRGSYMYDEVEDKNAYSLGDLSSRYFSEMVLSIKNATASSKEVDKDWKHNKDR